MTPGGIHIGDLCNADRWRDFAWGHIASHAIALSPDIATDVLNAIKEKGAGFLPDQVVERQLAAAMSELGAHLRINLSVAKVRSTPLDDTVSNVVGVDYDRTRDPIPYVKAMSEQFLRVDVGEPLISIQRVRFRNYASTVLDLATPSQLENVRIVDRKAGIFHIMPTAGYLQLETSQTSEPLLVASRFRAWNYGHSSRNNTLPASWLVDYLTGPVDLAGRAGFLDPLLVNWVDARAGVLLFSLSGIAQGGGVASTSLSIDGVSRSVGTTASAMYGLNSAFEKVLDDYTKSIDWAYWRRKYTGVTVGLF